MRNRILAAAAVAGGVLALVLVILVAAGRPPLNDQSQSIDRALPPGGVGRPVQPEARTLTESIDLRQPGPVVPRDFLGLSFELSALPEIARLAGTGDFAEMLRSLGPGVLRFGGASADSRVAWTGAGQPAPPWASVALGAGELRDLRKLVSRVRWPVLLTVGLAHYDPSAAAREVRAAKTALGGWLAGIEIGNEPDAYARHGVRPRRWTFSGYEAQAAAYRRAIDRLSPGIPLLGPDSSGLETFESWGPRAAVEERLALLTGHHYPLSCHERPAPADARLLGPGVRRLEERSLGDYASVSRRSGIPFRLDEANTVSCGGRKGVSNTFAAALWAVDFISRAMASGIAGVNLQGNPANCRGYSPVCATTTRRLATGALRAQPEWYGLLLAKALIGDRPLRARAEPSRPNVDVTAFLDKHRRLQVVIVDDEPPRTGPLSVHLRVGSRFGAATALPLTAPSPWATTGVLLGGRAVAATGSWREPAGRQRYPDRRGVISLATSPDSATLVTVAPRSREARAQLPLGTGELERQARAEELTRRSVCGAGCARWG